jgi:hypothetical protein
VVLLPLRSRTEDPPFFVETSGSGEAARLVELRSEVSGEIARGQGSHRCQHLRGVLDRMELSVKPHRPGPDLGVEDEWATFTR